MADPVSVGATLGLTALGSVVQGMGAQESAQAQAQAYQYKAGVALLNKQINEQNARWAVDAGGVKAEEYGLKSKEEIAQTKVVQGASGFDVNSGSTEAVRDTQTQVAQYDQNVIRWDAAKTAYGYQTKATMDEAEANLDQMAAQQQKEAGALGMLSSFITGASSVGAKWMQAKQIGMV